MKRWFWKFVHNVISHPLLMTGTDWSVRFHDYTALRMEPVEESDFEEIYDRILGIRQDVHRVLRDFDEVSEGIENSYSWGVSSYLVRASNDLNHAVMKVRAVEHGKFPPREDQKSTKDSEQEAV